MPIDPLINLALQIATKLIPAAVDQADKLLKGVSDSGLSSSASTTQSQVTTYQCPKCKILLEFPGHQQFEWGRCVACDHKFPVVNGFQRCPCGELWKPQLEQEIIRCGTCLTLVAVYESKRYLSCECGNSFRDTGGTTWTTECCKTDKSKLFLVRTARYVQPTLPSS